MIGGNDGILILAKGTSDNILTDDILRSEIADATGVNTKCPVMRKRKDAITDTGMRTNPISGATNRFDMGDMTEK
jgi:hypothetical protein